MKHIRLEITSILAIATLFVVGATGCGSPEASNPGADPNDSSVSAQATDQRESSDWTTGQVSVERLTSGATAFNGAMSPDGSKVVFDTSGRRGLGKLYLLNLEDGSVDQLEVGREASHPSFGPDGSSIVFEGAVYADGSTEADSDLFLFDLESGKTMRLTVDGRASRPIFSPDGDWLYFVSEFDVCRIQAPSEDSDAVPFDDIERIVSGIALNPAPRPGGETVVFSTPDPAGEHLILGSFNLKSGESSEDITAFACGPAAFDPTGRYLAFTGRSNKGASENPDARSLYVLSMEDGSLRELKELNLDVHHANVSFSSDGRSILFTDYVDEDEEYDLFELRLG